MTFKVITEKAARKIVAREKFVVLVHTKKTCPVCDNFLPNVLAPIFAKERFKDIKVYEIAETLFFPVGSHPVTYFFREGHCIQHPAGAAPAETVENLLDTMYLGKITPLRPERVVADISTDVPKPKLER
jgi:hypothetical protein